MKVFFIQFVILVTISSIVQASRLKQESNCILEDNGDFFNLNGIFPSNNVGVNFTDPKSKDAFFHFNFCGKDRDFFCSQKLPICYSENIVSSDEKSKSYRYNLADKSNKLVRENGKLKISFNHSLSLPPFCKKAQEVQLTLYFYCGKIENEIELIKQDVEDKVCIVDFSWKTIHACVAKDIKTLPKKEKGVFMDPVDNRLIDLRPVLSSSMKTIAIYNEKETYSFYFNPSKEITSKSTVCSNALVCQVKINGSDFTRKLGEKDAYELHHVSNQLHLRINSTSRCGREESRNVTSIFILSCSNDTTPKIEFLSENKRCEYVFDLETNAVCESNKLPFPSISSYEKTPNATNFTEIVTTLEPEQIKSTKQSPTFKIPLNSTIVLNENVENATQKMNLTNNIGDLKPAENKEDNVNKKHSNAFGLVLLILISLVAILLAIVLLIKDHNR